MDKSSSSNRSVGPHLKPKLCTALALKSKKYGNIEYHPYIENKELHLYTPSSTHWSLHPKTLDLSSGDPLAGAFPSSGDTSFSVSSFEVHPYPYRKNPSRRLKISDVSLK